MIKGEYGVGFGFHMYISRYISLQRKDESMDNYVQYIRSSYHTPYICNMNIMYYDTYWVHG